MLFFKHQFGPCFFCCVTNIWVRKQQRIGDHVQKVDGESSIKVERKTHMHTQVFISSCVTINCALIAAHF